ncbi:MAG TPA: putative maltokinase, partial [Bradyrhizobium sp.]|uniref:putative maltokinase n=1 Tax=Bradyrhizobium sp. TaxID=376 RepID=UPI002D7ED248
LFLRNHDELTLEMVTDDERDYMYSEYAREQRMRVNVGIRRRLAPLLDNSRRRQELLHSLLFSMPGTPILYYGDEIGMGDNIYLGDRNGVRTPMQWSPDRNGGFSRADPARLYAPAIMDPVYGYESVNVEAQSRSLSSLLSATKRLIAVRKSTLAFGRGSITFIRPANRAVLAYVRQLGDEAILCVANLSRSAQATELDLSAFKERIPLEMLGRTHFPAIGELPYMITLAPYGFYWFQLQERDKSEPAAPSIVPEFETLVVPVGATWVSLARTRTVFECDVLPGHLARSRWFPVHNPSAIHPTLTSAIPFCDIGDNRPWLAFFQLAEDETRTRYVLPMQIEWVRFDRERYNPNALAAVRQGAREGTLLDVAASPIFVGLLLRNLSHRLTVEEGGLKLEFTPTSRFIHKQVRVPERIAALDGAPFSSSLTADSEYSVKLLRKLESGVNPEIEIGRFLTEVAEFPNTPPMLGCAELIEGEARSAIAIVHVQIGNQGDAWTVTAAYLDRLLEAQRLLAAHGPPRQSEEQIAYMRHLSQIGRRTAELHLALATADGLPDLAPAPIAPQDTARWIVRIIESAERVCQALKQRRNSLAETDRALADELLTRQANLRDHLDGLLPPNTRGLTLRLHGDFHLGRVLIVKDDVFLTGFEGDVRQPIEERRRKAPAARDVASLIWSIEGASQAARERALHLAPDEHGRLGAALADWVERATAAFVGAYRELMSDSAIWPTDAGAARRMVDFFLLEKAFDVLETDLLQRTDAAPATLSRILRILSQPAREAA